MSKWTAVACIAASHFALMAAGNAFATEVAAENLRLVTTAIKTQNAPFTLTTDFVPAFSQTTVHCPRRETCTLRVELSAHFSNIQSPNVAAAILLVDSSQTEVQPFAVVGLDSTSTGSGSNARTYAWMKTGLAAGPHTIDLFLYTTGGTASVPSTVLTAQVYSHHPSADGHSNDDGKPDRD